MPNKYAAALHAEMVASEPFKRLIEKGDVWMSKDKPSTGSGIERKPWKKRQYVGKVIRSEERDNNFFKDEAYLDSKYTRVEDDKGRVHWEDDKGAKFYLDDPVERTQYFLTIEVLDGEKRGDWCWVWAPHRFGYKKDGTVFGVRAKIALAIDEDFNLMDGIEDDNSDLLDKPFYFTVEPKQDPQYCKVRDFLPMEPSERVKYMLGADEVEAKEGDEDIQF